MFVAWIIMEIKWHGWLKFYLLIGWSDSTWTFNVSKINVLLLIDNCSAYDGPDTLPELSNVRVMFSLLNTTTKLQPCDATIIASLKMRYRSYQHERATDLSEETSAKKIYKFDIQTAMQGFSRIRRILSSSFSTNCWSRTRLFHSNSLAALPPLEITG